ncbi:hypothetical protein ISN45_At03g007410 [Arabidopsis thaliana x Arabidopsis arenosa]|jgi:hypothetical protein|uniref:Uncharacterized protein At3g07460 n=4 Tax=Arabidopsis TaxID=3701 RepID=Q8L7K5_ARATH|nr:transmembrane protein, putative (Protein of unknown function, DUF538) [Arabidopsis thaliana]KAG7624398.1 hypothetical protein ISN45_At03g007410 [Arabidopsis thaliana x Arabidopsis arenosa]KAG7630415.1 hypothetical protein ISN44_As03g007500 [Arabidopsis suecica]AAM91609.1 unknown protein [Arabidopsis thaliana]AAN15406.1 unknown protein [Arabidopsis thaliana]AEE74545.1 transmembrane protein, putative (Protein of unknown function, DUF538) [Arabidopsis thaliana]|eukprot:NP_683539.1 transmembrane protein, putative (Protein of unknown function, DUF538) [Arabidopsis thaliana]
MLRIVQITLLCFVLAAGISISAVIAENESIDEILLANGLPLGLFPKGVKGFTVNGETGRFSVYLNQSCQAKYETELHYDEIVSGTIGYAQIRDLSGISAQELFLWLQVKGIRVDVPSSGLIFFDVGVLRKQYSLSLFETPRDCVAVRGDAEFIGENKVQSSMLPLYQVDQTLGRNTV